MEYNVLSYSDQFVDGKLLTKGIYLTSIPRLYSINTTREILIEEAKNNSIGINSQIFNIDNYINNISKCELIRVNLEKIVK